jgi:hypothetical protein
MGWVLHTERRMSGKQSLEATDKRLPEVVERLKAGSALIEESKKLGFSHNGPLRAALRKHLGGGVQYDALMEGRQRSGGRSKKGTEKES